MMMWVVVVLLWSECLMGASAALKYDYIVRDSERKAVAPGGWCEMECYSYDEWGVSWDYVFDCMREDDVDAFEAYIKRHNLADKLNAVFRVHEFHVYSQVGAISFTLLQAAAYFNAVKLIRWLLKNNADMEMVADEYRLRALHFAARGVRGFGGLVELLKNGADPKTTDFWEKTFVHTLGTSKLVEYNRYFNAMAIEDLIAFLRAVLVVWDVTDSQGLKVESLVEAAGWEV